jgi:hypothetical protein
MRSTVVRTDWLGQITASDDCSGAVSKSVKDCMTVPLAVVWQTPQREYLR